MKEKIIGLWKLKSWKITMPDGTEFYPYGKDVTGYIDYHIDGFVSVHMSSKSRSNLLIENLFDIHKLTKNNAVELFRTYGAYCGHYEVKADRVYHNIEICHFPNWVGKTVSRKIEIKEDELHLIHEEQIEGNTAYGCVIWHNRKK